MYEQIDLYSLDSPTIIDPKTHEEYLEWRQAEEDERELKNIQFLKDQYLSMVDAQYDHRAVNIFGHLRNRPLETLEEINRSMDELTHFIKNKSYYITLERIELGEQMRDETTDDEKRIYYNKILAGLYAEIEKLLPKEEIA